MQKLFIVAGGAFGALVVFSMLFGLLGAEGAALTLMAVGFVAVIALNAYLGRENSLAAISAKNISEPRQVVVDQQQTVKPRLKVPETSGHWILYTAIGLLLIAALAWGAWTSRYEPMGIQSPGWGFVWDRWTHRMCVVWGGNHFNCFDQASR